MSLKKRGTNYPRKNTVAWHILNIIKDAGPSGIRRKDIMEILFPIIGKGYYRDMPNRHSWYSSYFTDTLGAAEHRWGPPALIQYGIVPKLCKKVEGKYWVLNTYN